MIGTFRRLAMVAAVAAAFGLVRLAAAQSPLGSAFTYQGRLNLNGNPVNGLTDMKLSLWNADTNGNQIGSILTFATGGDGPPVNLANGLFAVDLDFGPTAFNGSARWLKVEVRSPAGVGAYTTLSPRQAINPTPHTIYSRSGGDSFLRGIAEYKVPGNSAFTVPAGVNRLSIEAWSGGGGGGAGLGAANIIVLPSGYQVAGFGGTGGGSGGYVRSVVSVVPGEDVSITVGAGGSGGLPGGSPAQAGGSTSVSHNAGTLISILGGQPGNQAMNAAVAGAAGGIVQTLSEAGVSRSGRASPAVDYTAPPPVTSCNPSSPPTGTIAGAAIAGSIEFSGSFGGPGGAYFIAGFPTTACPGKAGGDGYVLIQW